MPTDNRISWDNYFMKMAFLASERSTCLRRKVGAVLVRSRKVLATGYNGAPKGVKNCLEIGSCIRDEMKIPSGERHELCRGAHAEANAIAQAAQFGVQVEGATIYCTNFPCSFCSKLLINAGVKEFVFKKGYADELSRQLLEEAGIKARKIE
jgi:dCMP deaminase